MGKESVYGFTFERFAERMAEYGHKPSRATRVWEWLYRRRTTEFRLMEDVNANCIRTLEEHFELGTMTEHTRQDSADGTVKLLFRLRDGNLIETVLMRHKFGLSVCVTTQVGCNIGCSFCASGLLAKKRDLGSGEIVEQVLNMQRLLDGEGRGERVTHMVVMGIGEPFDNYANISDFLHTVQHHKGLAIGPRHITVSTSGLTDKIEQFADSDLKANLAVSLHAPNNELRTRIMKINRAYPIEKLMKSIQYYLDKTKRRITLEYILLKDVNDGVEHAQELADLVGGISHMSTVNLIPYNPVDEHSQYQRSERPVISAFFDTLKKRGINCSVRLEHGADIDAACGQLRSKQMKVASGN